ncbi:hypothetical protein QMT40_002980 [Parvibaculaceae bacterium PLY_AMNH_Bact1]|nr:hypothetical protein QMT40_002980 [Parvibaculaceae bacterium PLY_AMNH_Bact1]
MIEIAFLVEIQVTPPDGGAASWLYLADTALKPFGPHDPDRPNQAYDPRVKDAGNVVRGIDLDNLDGDLGGGVIAISNNDGVLTAYRSHQFGQFAIYRGTVGAAFADYDLLLSGLCGTPEFGRSSSRPDRLLVPVFDPRADLEKDIQETLYAGTNAGGGSGYEGTSGDLKDRPKPVALGNLTKANVPAIWANAEDLVAQVSDGGFEALSAIYNGGGDANQTLAGDLTGAVFDNATPGDAEYVTDLARGYVKFGSRPVGAVTFDLKGSTQGMYFEDAPALIQRVLENAGITSLSPGILATVAPEPVGVWLNEPASVGEVVAYLARSIGAVVLPDRMGVWQLIQVAPPTDAPVITFEADDLVVNDTNADPLATPTWRVTVNYARNYSVMTGSDLQGSVEGTEREGFLAQEWRTAIVEDTTIKDRWPGAVERTLNTGLVNEADAQALATRLLDLYGPRTDGSAREVVEAQVPMTDATLALEVGQTVRLADGVDRNFIVTRIAPTRPRRHLLSLELFG